MSERGPKPKPKLPQDTHGSPLPRDGLVVVPSPAQHGQQQQPQPQPQKLQPPLPEAQQRQPDGAEADQDQAGEPPQKKQKWNPDHEKKREWRPEWAAQFPWASATEDGRVDCRRPLTELAARQAARVPAAAAVTEPLQAVMDEEEDQDGQPSWCEDEGMLSSMYGLQHCKAPNSQDPARVAKMVELVSRCLQQHQSNEDMSTAELATGLQDLGAAAGRLQDQGRTFFLPAYGCALLVADAAQPAAALQPDEVHLLLLFLDGWEFGVHSTLGRYAHTAAAAGHQLLPVGTIPAWRVEELVATWGAVIEAAKRLKKSGTKGHQTTPAFAMEALHVAHERVLCGSGGNNGSDCDGGQSRLVHARGGTTDVGPHTGSEPRDTCWPLAWLVLGGVVDAGPLHTVALAHLHAWLAGRQATQLRPATATPAALNAVMAMLSAAAAAVTRLADGGHDVQQLEASMTAARALAEGVAACRALRHAARAALPPPGEHWPQSVQLPGGTLPPPAETGAEPGRGLEEARKRAARALDALPLFPDGCSFERALQIWRDHRGTSEAAALHLSQETERLLLPRVVHLAEAGTAAAGARLRSTGEVKALAALVDIYTDNLHSLLEQSAVLASAELVELKSRGVLVWWVAYCLTHDAAQREHPLLKNYGIALDWRSLQHLVLRDRLASDAALAVAAYLRQREQPGRAAFSLADRGRATFALAEEFSRSSSQLLSILNEHEAAATKRIDAHWEEVRRKQRRVAELRADVQRLKGEVRARQQDYEAAIRKRDVNHYRSPSWHKDDQAMPLAKLQLQSATSQYGWTQRDLSTELIAPAPVVQPLPEQSGTALQWLFFLHMGEFAPRLRCLLRAAFAAQQLLLWACSEDDKESLKVENYPTSILQHYNGHQASTYGGTLLMHEGSDGAVQLMSRKVLPTAIGPGDVDSMRSSRDGVWWPDEMAPEMAWCGVPQQSDAPSAVNVGFPAQFNPWAPVAHTSLVVAYTTKLPDGASELQPFLTCTAFNSISRDRGNLAIAAPDQRPRWMTKPALLAFAKLRSYPLRQLHHLAAALHERQLPLGIPEVASLVKMAVYHLGELTDAAPPSRAWHEGWEKNVLPALLEELGRLADDLADTPREHGQVALLGELAAHLSEHHPGFRDVARRFARMTSDHSDELERQLDALRAAMEPPGTAAAAAATRDSGTEAAQLIAKQLRSRAIALRCHALGELSDADAAQAVLLLVLINHGFTFLDDTSSVSVDLAGARSAASARAFELAGAARRQPEELLMVVVRRVLGLVPDGLEWQQLIALGTPLAAFEAVGRDDQGVEHLYSVNLVTGVVLLDGAPPNRLPADITRHPLFQRTFGDANFEVFRTHDGLLQTARPVLGRHYDFVLAPDGCLKISEHSEGGRLELLDDRADSASGTWGAHLPQRLRELHSHWLSRGQGGEVIVLRPRSFRQRDVHFIARCSPDDGAGPAAGALATADAVAAAAAATTAASGVPNLWRVFDLRRVPSHLRGRPWHELAGSLQDELTERLVLTHGDAVLRVLSKFEDQCFIHAFEPAGAAAAAARPGEGRLTYELPRFGLEFSLDETTGEVVSLQHRRALAVCQQLAASNRGDGGDTYYTLPNFSRYLVLQEGGGGGSTAGMPHVVMVPSGEVLCDAAGGVDVKVDGASGAALKAHAYEVHRRFGSLQASTIAARLELAALYAATASRLPEPASRMTGCQIALELVRRSWKNTALSKEEILHLGTAAQLGGHLLPALPLACCELAASAAQLEFLGCALNPQQVRSAPQAAGQLLPVQDQRDAAKQYVLEAAAGGWWGGANVRSQLTPSELLGASVPRPEAAASLHPLRLGLARPVEVTACSVPSEGVEGAEVELVGLVLPPPQQPDPRPYPLPVPSDASVAPLELDMHSELQASWDEHCRLSEPDSVAPGAKERITELQAEVSLQRGQVELYVLEGLGSTQDSNTMGAGAALRCHRLAGTGPVAGPEDLLRFVLDPSLLLRFNPLLSGTSCKRLAAACVLWGKLCVLEDRLERLSKLAQSDDMKPLAQELLVRRTWLAKHHPEWLALEVEGGLQIRPKQHTVAAQLIASIQSHGDEPGTVLQLNMGEGKTRVILPMLALHLAKKRGPFAVRLNVLSRLLNEAFDHLHLHLTASTLGRKLAVLPFNRDVHLTKRQALYMAHAILHVQQEGGLVLMAPEWRQSLLLKRQELQLLSAAGEDAAATVEALLAIERLPIVDILDESDELLACKQQLIYAAGTPVDLPSRSERVEATLAVLQSASRLFLPTAGGLLPAAAVMLEPPIGGRGDQPPPGSFSGVRLIAGDVLDEVLPSAASALARQLLHNPPYSLRWLANVSMQAKRMHAAVTDGSQPFEKLLGEQLLGRLEDAQIDQLLALRGLLAGEFSLLAHALQKRHVVDYGVNRQATARKRLAVPFRAAQTPSERSEFAQPDVALLLTALSYFKDGLSLGEFDQALETLNGLGDSARQAVYKEWLALSGPGLAEDEVALIDSELKIDRTNPVQMKRLHDAFSHNMGTIGFWLAYRVFAAETSQYPQHLRATSWHLASNALGKVAGFSGTKDTYRLMPTTVAYSEALDTSEGPPPGAAEMRATDGKMLDLLLRTPGALIELHALGAHEAQPMWQAVLAAAVEAGAVALLDTGALLASAGVTNDDMVKFLFGCLQAAGRLGHGAGQVRGATYHDDGAGCWVMADPSGRLLALRESPVPEADTFVVFDDARCRGADLKLRPDAMGVLTLGPGMTKDKFMQAAGRLRQLVSRGTQSVRFAAPPDVAADVRAANGLAPGSAIRALHVLVWVVANTAAALQAGVLEWAKQGAHFARTLGAPLRCLQPEVSELAMLYGDGRAVQPACDIVARIADRSAMARRVPEQVDVSGIGGAQPAASAAAPVPAAGVGATTADELAGRALEQIRQRGVRMAERLEVLASLHGLAGGSEDEEVERELAKELEQEEEVEVEVTAQQPADEDDWAYAVAVAAGSRDDLSRSVRLVPLCDAIKDELRLKPAGIGGLAWSKHVLCTPNFLRAARLAAGSSANNYLRPPEAVLVLHECGGVVLLSEREADGVMAAMLTAGRTGQAPRSSLLSLPYMQSAHERREPAPLLACGAAMSAAAGGAVAGGVGAAEVASARLFAAATTFGQGVEGCGVFRALVEVVRGGGTGEVEALFAARGVAERFERSDAQAACDAGRPAV